jgi:nitroimidazol reductase NimA-like FMN-containing flavoprotein (pyridoxamine 5'-phosphate oxidase superfamily)
MNEFIESREEMEALLRAIPYGCLGLARDGQPYVVPLNYAYERGRILFHCALEGEKLDIIASNPDVCFAVARQHGSVERHLEGVCHADTESVICYGRARLLADLDERTEVLNAFNRSFRPRAEPIPPERVANCGAVEIQVTEMTGRRERGGVLTCWRYRFS